MKVNKLDVLTTTLVKNFYKENTLKEAADRVGKAEGPATAGHVAGTKVDSAN